VLPKTAESSLATILVHRVRFVFHGRLSAIHNGAVQAKVSPFLKIFKRGIKGDFIADRETVED
jgi:hypothetical protein